MEISQDRAALFIWRHDADGRQQLPQRELWPLCHFDVAPSKVEALWRSCQVVTLVRQRPIRVLAKRFAALQDVTCLTGNAQQLTKHKPPMTLRISFRKMLAPSRHSQPLNVACFGVLFACIPGFPSRDSHTQFSFQIVAMQHGVT